MQRSCSPGVCLAATPAPIFPGKRHEERILDDLFIQAAT
jgi:hypothetical protein